MLNTSISPARDLLSAVRRPKSGHKKWIQPRQKNISGLWFWKFFTAGRTPAADRAINNLEDLCKAVCVNDIYEITVIDIIQDPQAAEDNRIIATPTVVRKSPPPIKKMIGDLSDKDQTILGLHLF